jgi:hypothetical protein
MEKLLGAVEADPETAASTRCNRDPDHCARRPPLACGDGYSGAVASVVFETVK